MVFMVIERFKSGDTQAFSERFRSSGRMLPEGVIYHASWVDWTGARCFQLMEAPNRECTFAGFEVITEVWASRWDDLIEFEIVPVQVADDFWSMVL